MSWPGWCASSSDSPPGAGSPAGGAAGWLGRAVVTTCTCPARSLVPVGADKPLRLPTALIAAHVHDHAARIEVFTGPPQIGVADARDRLAYQGRERALPQPARDVIAGVRRELPRHVTGPAAYVLPDTATQPSSVRPSAMRCHTATLTPPAGPRVRSTSPRPQLAAQGIQDTVLALPALGRSSCPPVMMNRPATPSLHQTSAGSDPPSVILPRHLRSTKCRQSVRLLAPGRSPPGACRSVNMCRVAEGDRRVLGCRIVDDHASRSTFPPASTAHAWCA